MDRVEIVTTLRAHEQELRRRGVLHAALFGCIARGAAGPGSDIDILIQLAQDAEVGVFEYVAITHYLADLFPARVDVANQDTLKPLVRPSVERDAVYAF
ncbi:MAG: nucleotidyltransferase domain-containing protein [Acetobacteraceae bacterium]